MLEKICAAHHYSHIYVDWLSRKKEGDDYYNFASFLSTIISAINDDSTITNSQRNICDHWISIFYKEYKKDNIKLMEFAMKIATYINTCK